MFPFLQVFQWKIPMYGVCVLIGLAAAIGIVQWRSRPMGVARDDSLYCCLLACVGLIVGGKLLYLLTILPQIFLMGSDFWQWENLQAVFAGGYVFYGGLAGALAMVVWYTKRYKIATLRMLDCLAVGIPLAHSVGRLGCFCAGCCYGIPVPWGMQFNASLVAPHEVALLPVQLIESGLNFILFLAMLVLSFRPHKSGRMIGWYLLSYSVMRFVLEFFRYDAARGSFLWFSTSQWISLLCIPLAMWLILRTVRSGQNEPKCIQ